MRVSEIHALCLGVIVGVSDVALSYAEEVQKMPRANPTSSVRAASVGATRAKKIS